MLRSQDLLVLLRLATAPRAPGSWRQTELASAVGLSQPEVNRALSRAAQAGLYDLGTKQVRRLALLELLVHGVKYMFPARLGAPIRGVPTAWAAPPLAGQVVGGDESERPVWPSAEGKVRGSAVAPLYKTAPRAALNDRALYEVLALVDTLRLGRARERQLAERALKERLTA